MDHEEQHRLTAVQGLAALSLDALSSVAYGPEAILGRRRSRYHRLVVLIPEVQPKRFWHALLFSQRGVILDRAIRRGTGNVVLCRLRYRLEQIASG